MEDLILNKIKQSEQPKATRKRIDVAEVITADDYVSDLQEKSAVKIRKEKVEKQTESTKKTAVRSGGKDANDKENGAVKQGKKRGRKPKNPK